MSTVTAPVRLVPSRLRRTPRVVTRGGSSRCSCSSDCRPSSSTRRGRRFRAITTRFGPYLSPFYSPELFGDSPHSWFGPKPGVWPAWLPFSPALLILPIPGFFRLTCYYYRGAYYKAFWADPPSCTVGEPRHELLGRELVSAHPAERPSLHAVPVGWPSCSSCRRRLEGAVVHRSRDGQTSRSASASARSSWPSTSCCSAGTCSAATRCVTSSAAASISSRVRRSASGRIPA